MTSEQLDQLALEVACDLGYGAGMLLLGDEITNFARRYRAALAAKMGPGAWLFQHGETGRTTCIDDWQVQNGFEEINPRLQKIHPLYSLED